MWGKIGHKTSRGFACDLCGGMLRSLAELIPHSHAHGVTRIQPVFRSGVIYGLIAVNDPSHLPNHASLPDSSDPDPGGGNKSDNNGKDRE